MSKTKIVAIYFCVDSTNKSKINDNKSTREEQEELGVHSCKVLKAMCYYMMKDCD